MIMADVMIVTSIILGSLLGINALWLLCRGIWLEDTIDACALCREGLKKNFFYGILPTIIVWFLVAVTEEHLKKAGKVISPALLCLFVLYSSIGVTGFVSMIGERLLGTETPLWKTTLVGGSVFSLACILPILGWFVLLPMGIAIGCGAKWRVKKYRKRKYAPPKEAPTEIKPQNDEDLRLA